MSIKRTFNGATIIKPGAYSKVVVENLTGFPLQPTGVVGIIGEAVGGEPRVLDILSKEGIQDAKTRYKSGPIADALELLANPSKDPRIPNGASKIVVYKTNGGTQSSIGLKNDQASPVDMLSLKSANWGDDENQISALVSTGEILDAHAVIKGTIGGDFILAGTETLIVKANGVDYTFTNTLVGSKTAAELVAELQDDVKWGGTKPVIAEVYETNKIMITIDPAVVVGGEYDYGYMMIDVASTLDTIVGLTGENRGVKGSRIFTFSKGVFSETSLELGGVSELLVKYIGAATSCKLSIKKIGGELKLQTTCVGVAADDLDIVLEDSEGRNKYTMKALADLMVQGGKYEVTAVGPNPQANANLLDYYEDLEITHVQASLNKDVYEMQAYITTFMSLVNATKEENIFRGLAVLSTPQFLTGASDGTSANSDFVAGFEAFKEERINCVVPLISKDSGALTIDSINALASNHAAWGWSTTGKSERHAFVSIEGSKTAFKDACKALNTGYVTCVGQQVRVLDKNGELQWKAPWALACVLAGMRAGAEVGEPLTYKVINVNDARVFDGSWLPRKHYAEMIEAGCTIVEPMDAGGFRVVVGNTTYVTDPSFVWNRESVVQAAGYVAYDLRFNLELSFTGTKAKTGTAEALANFIKNRMSAYLDADIIVGDDLNDGVGYSNLSVSIQGNTAIINVSITPVQGIDFILPTIYLADIRQSA